MIKKLKVGKQKPRVTSLTKVGKKNRRFPPGKEPAFTVVIGISRKIEETAIGHFNKISH